MHSEEGAVNSSKSYYGSSAQTKDGARNNGAHTQGYWREGGQGDIFVSVPTPRSFDENAVNCSEPSFGLFFAVSCSVRKG